MPQRKTHNSNETGQIYQADGAHASKGQDTYLRKTGYTFQVGGLINRRDPGTHLSEATQGEGEVD